MAGGFNISCYEDEEVGGCGVEKQLVPADKRTLKLMASICNRQITYSKYQRLTVRLATTFCIVEPILQFTVRRLWFTDLIGAAQVLNYSENLCSFLYDHRLRSVIIKPFGSLVN